MKRIAPLTIGFALLMLLVALGGGVATVAEIGTFDDVPAATLLLPYFEVDLDGNLLNNAPSDLGNMAPLDGLPMDIAADLYGVIVTGYTLDDTNFGSGFGFMGQTTKGMADKVSSARG